MKTVGKVILVMVLAVLSVPLLFIVFMLDPFFEIFHKEEDYDSKY